MNAGEDAISALLQSARAFREREYGGAAARMPGLVAGQRPGAMMIACADSRVDPALLFGTEPGELLVVRAVANLVPPPDAGDLAAGVMAAVELGVKTLGIPHLIVCGHSQCAGVRIALDSALQNTTLDHACLHDWTAVAGPACREAIAGNEGLSTEELARHAEQRSIIQSLRNLRGYAWLQNLETAGKLSLHGWWFDIATGELWIADSSSHFVRLGGEH